MGSAAPPSSSKLFKPLKIGNMSLEHRLVMAPLTRFRADDQNVPLPFVEEYYAQRASVPGTLLITEATFIAPQAAGYPNIPGIWNNDQIAAWKKITNAVHAKGSYIYLQLWALGRVANPDVLKTMPGGPYPLRSSGNIPEKEGAPTPQAMTESEIKEFISLYAQAAKNSITAGFDGVEIHSANGYLIDQFLQDTCNNRTDSYGGSIPNRSRFGLEVAQAVVDAIGADKVGIRLSPFSPFQGMKMEDPIPQFTHYIKNLKPLNLAYLHVVESRISGNADIETTEKIDFAVKAWNKTSPVLVAGGFKPDSAIRAVDEEYNGEDVAIVFGRYFISNPDLVWKVRNGVDLTKYDRDTFYKAKSQHGYTDYPFDKDFKAENSRL
jgi:NADPH2 dehydrogenase